MTDALHPETPPIDADDPRLSEWIDGRLGPTEAIQIERAVQASPELAAIVADLRTIRRALRSDFYDLETAEMAPVNIADRVMAAIAGGGDHREHITAPVAVSVSSRRRPLPWLGLAGALAAGLLVTIVVNRPKETEREVALAPNTGRPPAEKAAISDEAKLAGTLAGAASRDEAADYGSVDTESAKGLRGEEEAVREFAAAKQGGGIRAGEQRDDAKSDSAADALSLDEVAGHQEAQSVAPPAALFAQDKLEKTTNALSDKDAGERANSVGGFGRASAKGELAPGSPVIPAPAAAPAPSEAELKALADAGNVRARATPPAPKSAAPAAKEQLGSRRAKVELAGVLVIAVSPSERRALDRIVADSGLEVTPDADHLELVGARAKVDEFLGELERLGLVAAAPARQSQGAAAGKKRKGDDQDVEKKGAEKVTSLVLRVVERKTKKPAVAPAPEAETKP